MHQSEPFIEALHVILREEIDAYAGLLTIQQTEKQLLVARQLEAFLSHLHSKEQALRHIAHIEARRQAVVQQLASVLEVSSTITLQHLIARMPAPQASTTQHYRVRLQELLSEVQHSSRENARLVQDALGFIEEALAFVAGLLPARPTYQASGTFSATVRGRLVSGTV